MIKGKAKIQLFEDGKLISETHEENMITNAVDNILNPPDYIESGMDSENDRSYNPLRIFKCNIADTAFHGVIVCRDKIEENADNVMLPWTNAEIGHAGIPTTNTDPTIGTYNENESGKIDNGYRHVWDFASDKANGEISCICLTTKDGGTGGYHDTFWDLSMGGMDLNSNSTSSFSSNYHTIVGRFIPNDELELTHYKWFYMDKLDNGNVRLLGKNRYDCGIYEVIFFDPTSISVSDKKRFCGIVSVKKVIELFPAPSPIPETSSGNFFHGSYFYSNNSYNASSIPDDEKEKLRNNWFENPQWLAFFPYVIGNEIHIVGQNQRSIYHCVYDISDYSRKFKKVIATNAELQNYDIGFHYVSLNGKYKWFYGAGVNEYYNSALPAFQWDGKYFAISNYPLIDGAESTSSENYGQLRIFSESGISENKTLQYINNERLSNMTTASFWGFYVDEKSNTPLLICDTYNINYSAIALEIIKKDDGYGWYRMRVSMPTYGTSYIYCYANFVKTKGLSLPYYVASDYPYSSNNTSHYFGLALGILKPCLTTINNLSSPVRKLDGQVMKITYDIVDEEE